VISVEESSSEEKKVNGLRKYCFCLEFPVAKLGCQDLSQHPKNQLVCLQNSCHSLWKYCPFCAIEEIIGKISEQEVSVWKKGACFFHKNNGPVSRRFQPLMLEGREIKAANVSELLEELLKFFPSEKKVLVVSTISTPEKYTGIKKSYTVAKPKNITRKSYKRRKEASMQRAKKLTREQIAFLIPIVIKKFGEIKLHWKEKLEKIAAEILAEHEIAIKPHTVARIIDQSKKLVKAPPAESGLLSERTIAYADHMPAMAAEADNKKTLLTYGLAIQKVVQSRDPDLLGKLIFTPPESVLPQILKFAVEQTKKEGEQFLLELNKLI
jgi:hypothetical protein